MKWTTSYHRFADRKEFLVLCEATGIPQDEEGRLLIPSEIALDEVGTITTGGAFAEDGTVLKAPTAVPGWHVNARWRGEMPKDWGKSRIDPEPNTPSRVFA